MTDFVAYLEFRSRYLQMPEFIGAHHPALYKEFATEDQKLAEEGMADYGQMPTEEDNAWL